MVSCFPTINKIATNDEAMLFCGSIHSGNLHNIVPDYSEIYGTIRTYSIKHREGIKNEINKTAHTIAQKYGTVEGEEIIISDEGEEIYRINFNEILGWKQ
jgi:metal-dependent amidase/aminoacylase/carboxypeptidase family protein